MSLQLRDTKIHNYGEYLTWSDDVRYELIDGAAYILPRAPERVHQEVVGEILGQASNALREKVPRVYAAPLDVRLPKRNEPDELVDTVVQPDVLVVCDDKKLDDRGVRGAPDWVVDVLSAATAGHDQIRKLAAYERAGVPEIWLVHPVDRVLTIYALEADHYGRPHVQTLRGSTSVTAVPGLSIDWERVLARLD